MQLFTGTGHLREKSRRAVKAQRAALRQVLGGKDMLFLTSAILKLHIGKTRGFYLNIPKTFLKFPSPDLSLVQILGLLVFKKMN